MKFIFVAVVFLSSSMLQAQPTVTTISAGIDYRIDPFDIEDIPRGALPTPKGFPDYNLKFWQTFSIHGQYGLLFKKNWFASLTLSTRYNTLHRTQSLNYSRPLPENPRRKKNFKYDLFADIEKKIPLKQKRDNYFLVSLGLGLTNINSKFDITLTDTSETGITSSKQYQGTMLHFGPRINLGYQHRSIKAYLNTYIIEGRDRINLIALWIGCSVNYEIIPRKKKKKQ